MIIKFKFISKAAMWDSLETLWYLVVRASHASAAVAPAIKKQGAAWSVAVTRKAGNATNVNQLITEIL